MAGSSAVGRWVSWHLDPWRVLRAYAGDMGMPAYDEPAGAESLAGRAVLTHLTVNGERVALIVPAALMDSLRILAGLLASGTPFPELQALLL